MKTIPILSCGLSLALAASAQQQPQPQQSQQPQSQSQSPQQQSQPQPQSQPPSENSINHWWRFESINPDNDWTRHFRIGGLVGMNIRANFKMSGTFNISGSDPSSGIYDDGYVRVDNTGDAGGQTSYWGYNSASQLSGSTLTMHSTKSFSASGGASDDASPYLGLDLAYGDSYWYWGGAKIGWEFGFGLLPIHIADNQPMAATVNRSVFSFNTGGIVVPTAPYNGGPSGIGPTISDAATQLPDDTVPGTVTGTRALDVMLFTARLGPSLYWDFGRHVGLYASAGPAIGFVSGELDYDETILAADGGSAHNSGHVSGGGLTFGGYVNATLVYHFVDEAAADIYIGAQYMPMTGATISGGGREGRLDLGGQLYLTFGINWPF